MAFNTKDILMGLSVPLVWAMGLVFAKDAIVDFPPILLMFLYFTVVAIVLVRFLTPFNGQLKKIMIILLLLKAWQAQALKSAGWNARFAAIHLGSVTTAFGGIGGILYLGAKLTIKSLVSGCVGIIGIAFITLSDRQKPMQCEA